MSRVLGLLKHPLEQGEHGQARTCSTKFYLCQECWMTCGTPGCKLEHRELNTGFASSMWLLLHPACLLRLAWGDCHLAISWDLPWLWEMLNGCPAAGNFFVVP